MKHKDKKSKKMTKGFMILCIPLYGLNIQFSLKILFSILTSGHRRKLQSQNDYIFEKDKTPLIRHIAWADAPWRVPTEMQPIYLNSSAAWRIAM